MGIFSHFQAFGLQMALGLGLSLALSSCGLKPTILGNLTSSTNNVTQGGGGSGSGGSVSTWAKQLGAVTAVPGGDTSQYDFCEGVAVDGSGNVYCAGGTTGSLGEANGGGGNSDAFVMKLNSSGQVQWITQLGAVTAVPGGNTSQNDQCNAVAVDGSGNVYCAGETFGSLGEANGGSKDAFVMKLNSSGQVQWITQLGAVTAVPGGDTSTWDYCSGVAVDGSGNVYCAGATFGGSLGEASGGIVDAFVMKLNSSGQVQWITQLGAVTAVPGGDTSQDDRCYGVAVDSSGNVYCGGNTSGSLGEANGGNYDAFVMKLNSSGQVQWITQLGAVTAVPGGDTSQFDLCMGVAVDGGGNVYCAGFTDGSLGEANGGGGNSDAFMMKLNSSGAVQWITQLGAVTAVPGGNTSQWDYCSGVAVDGSGNVYCAGATGGSFGEANGGSADAFVMKLDSSGALQWARQFGAVTKASAMGDNSNYEAHNGIAVDNNGYVYAAGEADGSFAETEGGGNNGDAMVVKISAN
jgi:hypothetical protein